MTCDLGIITNTTLAVAMQLSSIHILFLHSVLFDSVLTSYGLSCGWKPCCSSWYAASGRTAEPMAAASAARVPGLRTVRRGRLMAAMVGARARSRSTFSSKVEDLSRRVVHSCPVFTGTACYYAYTTRRWVPLGGRDAREP